MSSTINISEQLWDILDALALVEKTENGDVIIHNEQIDSVQLISIIVDIEERFMIEIPDEYLLPDFMSSFQHICNVITELVCITEHESSDLVNNEVAVETIYEKSVL